MTQSTLTRSALLALFLFLVAASAHADDYSVSVDDPLVGSSIPRNKVSLGIDVSIDSTWDELSDKEKTTWREFTDLMDPQITPPFPIPNIRSFLKKLKTPERFRNTRQLVREDGLLLIIRITAEGAVDQVEVVSGTEKGSAKLSQSEGVLAYVYSNALLATQFSPAKMNGKPAASAFPMRIRSITRMN